MARRRRSSKRQKMEQRKFAFIVTGILLVCFAILGFGFGAVGLFFKKCAMFVFGECWALLLVLLLILGLYFIVENEFPDLLSFNALGAILVGIVILTALHFSFIKNYAPSQIMPMTTSNLQYRINTINANASVFASGQSSIKIGGGIVGAAFASLFASLFAKVGTIIVLVVLSLIAFIMLFNFDIGEFLGEGLNWIKEKTQRDDDEEEDEEEIDEETGEVIKKPKKAVTPVQVAQEVKEEVIPEPVKEETPGSYRLPMFDIDKILEKDNGNGNSSDMAVIKATGEKLVNTLKSFEIESKVVDTHIGPAVTQYELEIPGGTKVSKILNINKEIALSLAAKDVRIEAPIPGKSTVGVEIPNGEISMVRISGILKSINTRKGIQVALGKDLLGNYRTCDITTMPHMLIAGATGSGKSVCTNSIIISILMRYRPDEVKLVLVDPKQVELSNYNGIPHLLLPVVTDPKRASATLQRIVAEMDDRYRAFAENSVKKISDYNAMIDEKNKKRPAEDKLKKMPYIVVIIDEMADLMLVARKEVEDSILRITQLARAAGIHLITATQRPSTDIITGVIKANIPSRIAFAVASQIDSRTILDGVGAEKLLGKGDMLFLPVGQNTATRIQGCYVSDDEIEKVINYVRDQQTAVYDEKYANVGNEGPGGASNGIGSGPGGTDDDPMYDEVYQFVLETGKASSSLLQRRFRLGYNRAARLIDTLEERGVIGPSTGNSKPREVLVGRDGTEEDE
jgi:S-DNA-T family DNA segregation ATPase FtsK/SpoIIIE